MWKGQLATLASVLHMCADRRVINASFLCLILRYVAFDKVDD